MYHRAKLHFKKADPILYKAAGLHAIANVTRSRDVFGDIVHAIVNQQLSGKAASTIFGRLKDSIQEKIGVSRVTPRGIAALSMPALRKCGLSGAKAATVKGLARAVIRDEIDLISIHKHADDKIVEILTSHKGIGPWTAEMILMHSLGRTDIFSNGDLGLRKGIMRLYGLKKLPNDRQMDRLARAWAPYRTYAARVLWRVADSAADDSRQ